MNITAVQLCAVASGGAIGALSRYGLGVWFATLLPGRFNPATLVVNVLGSLLIGVAYVVIVEKVMLPPIWRQLVMVGFLGAFTTFSTFSLEVLGLVYAGQLTAALAYMVASVLFSVAAVALGVVLTQHLIV